ncbi:hypothetical protein C8F04DRAFT_1329314 [Mycena alexandri]|uniref:Uncharacterized protein n=1 Tax=Mycena alexandri TaxID=1745969 RepID=A0AAD6RZ34_9AGAR|nr:hypothetical protein C8F04DRAFT_1329314 [Mycena alexandri]
MSHQSYTSGPYEYGHPAWRRCRMPIISGYVGTFVGLTIPSSKRELACSLIAGAISDDPRITSYVRSHRDCFPPEVSADEALARFCEHISVADITLLAPGNSGEYVGWNVYVEPFTDYEDVFAPFIDLVAGLEINTDWNGQGLISKRVFHCNICPGTDHPTNLCPVPSTPATWAPPPPPSPPFSTRAARQPTPELRSPGLIAQKHKWHGINRLMFEEKIGALVVGETHLSAAQADEIQTVLGKRLDIYNSPNPDNPSTRGITLVLNREITNTKGVKIWYLKPGRAILAVLPWHGQLTHTVLGVYAPAESMEENEAFWNELCEMWLTTDLPVPDSLVGDTNLVEGPIDRLPHRPDSATAVAAPA